ncbi:MAG TPA: DUF2268 domain-containing putative Zn-dependent protease [Ignavibacteria bacterium]|nr:DUF2268 domain-containing putative Zn-dependent protease [Ignavibacteria bacterium]
MKIRILFFVLFVSSSAQTALFSQDAATYSKQGDSLYYIQEYDSSAAKYEESLKLDPANRDVIYNAACVYSLLGRADDAFGKLEKLPGLGYENVNWISEDTDLEKLRGDARWLKLIEKLQANLDKRKDIRNMKIVTTDINNFWEMYDVYKITGNIEDIQKLYFDKRSAGLDAFTKVRVINAVQMEKAIKMYPEYLESIRDNTLKLSGINEKITGYFTNLKEIYPDVYFPDVYFTMGCFNTGGTATGRMLLIGAELMCADDNSPKDKLNSWLKGNIGNFDNIEQIVMHESIHTMQTLKQRNLLGAAILEGACDFIASMVTGHEQNSAHYIYGNRYEKGLWKEFKKEMNGDDYSRWLYSGNNSIGRPSDLGYFIGYKICEAYYENADDKKQAVKDIIEVKDFEAFLKKSGYDDKFK